MFDGHVDELGLIVKHIDGDGYLYFQQIGGVDPALLRGKRVNIHTAKGVVRGVVGAVAIHLQDRGKDAKPPKIHELFIDIGAKDGKDAAKRVAIGDPMTFVDDFEMLTDRLLVARACDDRVGAWAALESLRVLASHRKDLKAAIYATSSVQEEVGLHGARMNVLNVRPDVAIAVEVTHATDVPGVDVKRFGEVKLGKGPTVSIGRENHPVLVSLLRKIAKRKKLDLQIETFSVCGGTDALAIFNQLGGIPAAVLGVPNRYMHTTVEMVDLRDLDTCVRLLTAFALDLKKNQKFKVKV
jgi:endoglucanase